MPSSPSVGSLQLSVDAFGVGGFAKDEMPIQASRLFQDAGELPFCPEMQLPRGTNLTVLKYLYEDTVEVLFMNESSL